MFCQPYTSYENYMNSLSVPFLWTIKASILDNVIDAGLNTTWKFLTTHLEPGTHHYIMVRAWNEAGLQTTAVSDGFLVDVTAPRLGVVFASGNHGNRRAQSSLSEISASWHSFQDLHSGVKSYSVAVYDTDIHAEPVRPLADVGVKSELRLNNLILQHGHRYGEWYFNVYSLFQTGCLRDYNPYVWYWIVLFALSNILELASLMFQIFCFLINSKFITL